MELLTVGTFDKLIIGSGKSRFILTDSSIIISMNRQLTVLSQDRLRICSHPDGLVRRSQPEGGQTAEGRGGLRAEQEEDSHGRREQQPVVMHHFPSGISKTAFCSFDDVLFLVPC